MIKSVSVTIPVPHHTIPLPMRSSVWVSSAPISGDSVRCSGNIAVISTPLPLHRDGEGSLGHVLDGPRGLDGGSPIHGHVFVGLLIVPRGRGLGTEHQRLALVVGTILAAQHSRIIVLDCLEKY